VFTGGYDRRKGLSERFHAYYRCERKASVHRNQIAENNAGLTTCEPASSKLTGFLSVVRKVQNSIEMHVNKRIARCREYFAYGVLFRENLICVCFGFKIHGKYDGVGVVAYR